MLATWFNERAGSAPARRLLKSFNAGELTVLIPRLAFLEILNIAARRWRYSDVSLLDLSHHLTDVAFQVDEPALPDVAAWAAQGLTACDATYVALAERREVALVTEDEQILRAAPEIARRPKDV